MKPSIFLFFTLLIIGCKQPNTTRVEKSFKDTVVKQYFARIDSADFYDTIDYDYKVLKAYLNNDTVFLKTLSHDLELSEKESKAYPRLDTCIHLKKLSEMNVDEVYRFSHGQSFCYSHQRITISRIHDTVRLHYIEFTMPDDDGNVIKLIQNGKEMVFGPGCAVIKEFEKRLSMKDWESLEMRLSEADYWGLKKHNPVLGFDGSSWQIDGFTKRPKYVTGQQIQSVNRWSPTNSFADLGRLFIKLSGEKTLCGTFE